MSRSLLSLTLMTIFSCATPPVERIPFPREEYAALEKSGSAVVSGQAFLKTRGGDVKTAAGEEVYLNPVTSYSEQWYEVAYTGGRALTEADPSYSDYVQTTIADGDGRFSFSN